MQIELTGTDIDIHEVDHEDYFIIAQETEKGLSRLVLRACDIPKIIDAVECMKNIGTQRQVPGMTWANCETGAAEKRARIATGITRIRKVDEHGVEHIGVVHSFDYADDEWVLVSDITPPQTGDAYHRTVDKWDLISCDIEVGL